MRGGKPIIILVSLVFLGFVGFKNYSLKLDTVFFTPESFYRGSSESQSINPKEYYKQIHGLTTTSGDENDCQIQVKNYKDSINVRSQLYMFKIIKDTEVKNGNWKKYLGKEAEGIFKRKDEIVMPISSPINGNSFKNSNMLDSSFGDTNGKHNIEVYAGKRILIVFEDVLTWWCHAHNPKQKAQHTVAVGNHSASERSEVSVGDVIGIAKNTTKVKVYWIPDDVFNSGVTVENVKDISQMVQIHTGKYFQDQTKDPV